MVAVLEEATGVAPLKLSEAGSWLCSRHSDLQQLVRKIGAWKDGEPYLPDVRRAVCDYDAAVKQNLPPMSVLRHMMPAEIHKLRLLATLAPKSAFFDDLHWCVRDMECLGDDDLVLDWLRAVRIGVVG